MKSIAILCLFLALFVHVAKSQEAELPDTIRQNALNLYMTATDHIRREISYVNYVRDIKDADVYIISTSQPTGAGGRKHTIFITGQRSFAGMNDTLSYTVFPDDTQEVTRAKQIKSLHMGLMRYVAKTPLAQYMSIRFDQPMNQTIPTDPWNNWVFRSSANGYLNGQKTYNSMNIWGQISANRITEKSKFESSIYYDWTESNYDLGNSTLNSISYSSGASFRYVHGISDHWSIGGSTSLNSSSYNNYDLRFQLLSGIEYNIFPYSESTRRQFRLLYRIGMEYNNYIDTTIYNMAEETLAIHLVSAAYQVVQKWGNVNVSCNYRNYLHDFELRNLSLNGSVSLRVFKGLSVSMSGGASLIHDQLSLVKGGATNEDILLRQKQLATQYSYYTSFGLSYTFGSIYNNVVNPRFGN